MPTHKGTHNAFHRGKRVILHMRDGRVFVDKFIEKRSKYLVFDQLGKVFRDDIFSVSIYRAQGNTNAKT